MRLPWISRRRYDALMRTLADAKKVTEEERAKATDLQQRLEAASQLVETISLENHFASKILGILTRRQTIRVEVEDMKGKAPRIAIREERDGRKPHFKVVAYWDDKPLEAGEATIVDGRTMPKVQTK